MIPSFLPSLLPSLLVCHVVIQEGDKRQLRESSVHPAGSERYVHTFRDLSNFSGTINVTYRYLAGTPLNRKSEFLLLKEEFYELGTHEV